MKLYLLYNDIMGYVTVEVDGNVSFLDGMAYFTCADGTDMKLPIEQVIDIGLTENLDAL